MAKMRLVPLALLAAWSVSACGGANGAGVTTHRGANDSLASATRDALVYAAVIRQLVTKDHGFGGAASPYRHVYVLDGPVPSAGDPMGQVDHPRQRFGRAVAAQIRAALEPVAPLTFVHSRRRAIRGVPPGHVIGRGVLITLGPIKWVDADTARVANSRWASGLNGRWLTYNVRRANDSWRVAGVVGGVAIS